VQGSHAWGETAGARHPGPSAETVGAVVEGAVVEGIPGRQGTRGVLADEGFEREKRGEVIVVWAGAASVGGEEQEEVGDEAEKSRQQAEALLSSTLHGCTVCRIGARASS